MSTRFQEYIFDKIYYKKEFLNINNDAKKFSKYYTKTYMLLKTPDTFNYLFQDRKHLYSDKELKREYRAKIEINKKYVFRPLQILADQEEKIKGKYKFIFQIQVYNIRDFILSQFVFYILFKLFVFTTSFFGYHSFRTSC